MMPPYIPAPRINKIKDSMIFFVLYFIESVGYDANYEKPS